MLHALGFVSSLRKGFKELDAMLPSYWPEIYGHRVPGETKVFDLIDYPTVYDAFLYHKAENAGISGGWNYTRIVDIIKVVREANKHVQGLPSRHFVSKFKQCERSYNAAQELYKIATTESSIVFRQETETEIFTKENYMEGSTLHHLSEIYGKTMDAYMTHAVGQICGMKLEEFQRSDCKILGPHVRHVLHSIGWEFIGQQNAYSMFELMDDRKRVNAFESGAECTLNTSAFWLLSILLLLLYIAASLI